MTNNIKFKFLRIREVMMITGYRRSAIYKKILEKDFPSPYELGGRAVAWRDMDIANWLNSRKKLSPAKRAKKNLECRR